ncbi:MAG TPA: hypothetical protein VHH36_08355, partial [Candidatus Thermoplasmatota archaeon]|nr:hypothetical protein [Candidatus Thermoplasmatota archaeon]
PSPPPVPDPDCDTSQSHAFWTTPVNFQFSGSQLDANCNPTSGPCRNGTQTITLPRPWHFEPTEDLPDPLAGVEDPVVSCEPLPPINLLPRGDGDSEFSTGKMFLPSGHHSLTEYVVTAFLGDGPFYIGADLDGDGIVTEAPADCVQEHPKAGAYADSVCQTAGEHAGGWWMWRTCEPTVSTQNPNCLLSGYITTA